MATASASAASCGDGTARQAEQQLHHLLHLVLLGAAVADDRALDFRRRVLDDRQAGLDRREHRDAARVPELQRAADVAAWNRFSMATQSGAALGEERREPLVNPQQLFGKRGASAVTLMAPLKTMRWREPSVSTQP